MVTNEYIDSLGIDKDKADTLKDASLTAFCNAVDGE